MDYFRGMNANVWRLVFAQMLAMTALNVNIIATGLVGAVLAPAAWLATLPLSVQFISTMFASLPASLLMSYFGRRPIFIIGVVLSAVALSLQGLAIVIEHYGLFLGASGLFGVSAGIVVFYRYAAADAVAADYKPKALSLVLAGGLFSALIGPEIAFRTPDLIEGAFFAGCYFTSVVAILLCLPVLLGLKLPKPDLSQGSGRPISAFFKQRAFLLALVAAALGYAFMTFVMTATPLQVVNVSKLSMEANARVIQWHVIGMFAPAFFTGSLIARFGARPIIWSGILLYALCLVVALNGVTFWHYFIALLLLGVGWNFLFIGGSSVIANYARPEERGRVQGVADFVILTCVSLASLAAGAAHSMVGWQILLQFSVVPIAIIFICLLLSREETV